MLELLNTVYRSVSCICVCVCVFHTSGLAVVPWVKREARINTKVSGTHCNSTVDSDILSKS